MTRARRDNNARGSRNYGKLSGVTITTNPSGVTIYKGKVDYTSGYSLPYATTSGLKMTTGILETTDGASGGTLARQALGLSAIYNVFASASSKGAIADVTGIAVVCHPEGTKSFGANCTQVTFVTFKLNRSGVTYNSKVSIHYFAIGT